MPAWIDLAKAEQGSAEWWLPKLEQRLVARQTDMTLFDDYYHGRHRMTMHTARVLEAFGTTFKDLRMNYCGLVVKAMSERLEVQGFRIGRDQAAADAAWEIWQRNRLDASFARGIRAGLAKGEFSIIVWVDGAGEPRMTVEDGSEVYVATNPGNPHSRRAAIKRWRDEDERRLYAVVYLPDGIYKFRSEQGNDLASRQLGELPEGFGRGGGAGPRRKISQVSGLKWERWEVDGEDWPLANPFGIVPVVPLPNKPDIFGVGESELAAIVPIQDGINANVVNVMLAGQFSAFRQRWATNVELEMGPDGKPVTPWRIAVDSMLTAPPPDLPGGPTVEFGEFEQTSLDGYISLHEAFVQGMATISSTPPHYFLAHQGNFPSGEALRSAEAGLTFKARDWIRDSSEPVEEAMMLAFLMKSRQASISTRQAAQFAKWAARTDSEVLWRDPEIKTESEHVDALVKLQSIGVPQEVLWSKIPATPQEIELWKTMPAPPAPTVPPVPDDGQPPVAA
jgi:hypothetical protein